MIEGYNATPENFGVPSDEVIRRVISLVDRQIEIDSLIEENLFSSTVDEILLNEIQSPMSWTKPEVSVTLEE